MDEPVIIVICAPSGSFAVLQRLVGELPTNQPVVLSEDLLWMALRNLKENTLLLNYLGDDFAKANELTLGAVHSQHVINAHGHAQLVRQVLGQYKLLTTDRLQNQTDTFHDTSGAESLEPY